MLVMENHTRSGGSFAQFYRREYRAMVALAAAVGGVPAAAEDIAQDALVQAHKAWPKIAGYEKPGAWLRRVTINLATNQRRKRRNEHRALRRVEGAHTVEFHLPDDGLWAAVAALPPKQRAAVALFYLEDLTIADIADVLDCAPGTAKAHLHQGRTALRAALSPQGRPS